jgi:outer membrane protein TolC
MRNALIALTIAGTSCLAFAGEPFVGEPTGGYKKGPYTLNDCVQLALKQNPNILNQVQQLKAQKGLFYQAQANLLPQVTATASYSQEDPGLSEFDDGDLDSRLSRLDLLAVPSGQNLVLTPNPDGTFSAANAVGVPLEQLLTGGQGQATESWQVDITVSQLIWDGGASIASRRAARINEDASYYTLRDTIDQVVSTVRTQFYQILLNRALIQVQEESVNLLRSQLDDQRSRFDAGTVPRFNVLQAEVALQNQIPLLIAARNNYRISQLNLARTLGIPAEYQYTSDEPLRVVGQLGYDPIKYDLASALAAARANRPFLKAQRSSILAAVENITVQAATFQPQFTASAGLRQQSNPSSNNLRETLQGWFLGVQGSWNIFDGLLTYGRVKEARAQLEQSKVTYDDSVRQVELEVSTAISNLRNAAETVVSSQATIVQSQEALRLANERLAAGTGTQLDVLDQRTQLTQARTNLVQAQFDYIAQVSEFQRSTATETVYNDAFDTDPLSRPSTLTTKEFQKTQKSRNDSPLDPGKPATSKAKREALTPPDGKIESGQSPTEKAKPKRVRHE